MSSPISADNEDDSDLSSQDDLISLDDDDDLESSDESESPNLPLLQKDSPLQSMPSDLRSALDEFRNNWKLELKIQNGGEPLTLEQQQLIEAEIEEEEGNDTLDPDMMPSTSMRNNFHPAFDEFRTNFQREFTLPSVAPLTSEQQKQIEAAEKAEEESNDILAPLQDIRFMKFDYAL